MGIGWTITTSPRRPRTECLVMEGAISSYGIQIHYGKWGAKKLQSDFSRHLMVFERNISNLLRDFYRKLNFMHVLDTFILVFAGNRGSQVPSNPTLANSPLLKHGFRGKWTGGRVLPSHPASSHRSTRRRKRSVAHLVAGAFRTPYRAFPSSWPSPNTWRFLGFFDGNWIFWNKNPGFCWWKSWKSWVFGEQNLLSTSKDSRGDFRAILLWHAAQTKGLV